MIAIQIADVFLLHRSSGARSADVRNLVIWVVGFAAYRVLMGVDTPLGSTLPDMVFTVILCVAAEKLLPAKSGEKSPA